MYTNKKVLIFGLGLNDGGLGIAEFFAKQGAILTITDGKTAEQLKEPIEKLSKYKNITYHLGGHIEQDFLDNDIIVRNPAIKPNNPYLKIAKDAGREIVMEMALFCKLSPCPVIGVTGTKGKSTTTTLIYEIFKKQYGEENVLLGGNIGKSAIRELPNLNGDDFAILELSSFQLEGMGESKVSPHVAVITNIYTDHIDWHGNREEYIKAKENIFLNQSVNDYLVLNIDDETSKTLIDKTPGNLKTYSLESMDADYYMDPDLNVYEKGKVIFRLESPILSGKHNYYNMLAAIAIARIYNISTELIKSVIENFKGVNGRQEFVKEIDGVKYYNDTCATSVEAIEAMLNRFGEDNMGRIIMIAGGVDKGFDYTKVTPQMKRYLKALILFEGTASEKISSLVDDDMTVYKYFDSMKSAIDKAKEISKDRDMIILCPGGASFNMFINEFDRGNKFVDYVNSL
jgi:UDP-N-acetylmuramoylalanine--D-glutamate ligase